MAGHAAGDRVDRVVDRDPALLELVGDLLDRVLGLGDGEAVAGDDDDGVGVGELDRRVLGADRDVTGRSSPVPPPPPEGAPPKPAKRMLATERFIAVAISRVRIVPEEPTRVPATISATLSRAKPAAAAERPVKAFSSEITTGMSAPPIGSTTRLPRIAAATRSRMKRPCEGDSLSTARTTQMATIAEQQDGVDHLLARAPPSAGSGSGPGAWRRRCSSPRRRPSRRSPAKRIGISESSGTVLAERDPVADLRPGDQGDGAAADAVVEGDHLRHLGHLHPDRGDDADRRADPEAEDDQAPVADPVEQQGGDHGDRHADGGDQVAALGGGRVGAAV